MDIKLLPARVDDLLLQCQKTSTPKFLGFLTYSESAAAISRLKTSDRYALSGGYEGAERTILSFMPDWCDEPIFPITAITFSYRSCDELSHRDFLGALMALGINRETVGDILIENGRAVAFVHNDVADFIMSQTVKIGSVGVSVQKGYIAPLPNASSVKACSDTVSSLRVDCVIASMCNFSRSSAAEAVADGRVAVNSVGVSKTTLCVKNGDIVTVRQKGRFKITSCEECSKKGRIILKYDKYI